MILPMRQLPMRRRLAPVANVIVHYLSRHERVARIAALLGNQCDVLIGYHFAPTPNPDLNGETWLLDRVAPHARRFIDVGANRGEWSSTVLRLNPTAAGLAIDAARAATDQLNALSLGGLTVVHAAVSDTEGEVTFLEEPEAGELSSLSARHARNAVPRQVRQITLDGLMAEHNWADVDILKVDAEGWDLHCLRGAEIALRQQRIAVVQFEYNAPWVDAGSTLKAAMDYLQGHGYAIASLGSDGLVSYDYSRFGEFFQYSNFVAYTQAAGAWLV
jgi:FkbM family methyltransferase